MSLSQQELEEFKAEAMELLDVAEKGLLALDGGAEFRSVFDAIFRSFHNLKGAAGMMELHKLQAHTHELENVLNRFKDASSMPKQFVGFFLSGVDATKSLLNGEDVEFDFKIVDALEEKSVAKEEPTTDTSSQSAVSSQQSAVSSQQSAVTRGLARLSFCCQ